MIEDVADRVWGRTEFQNEYRMLLRRSIQEYVRTDSPRDVVSDEVISRLLQSATNLAAVDRPDRKEAAYRIASSAWGLFGMTYGGSLRNLLLVVFGRLGNFPAIDLLFKGVQVNDDALIGVVPASGFNNRMWLEITSRAIDNEVFVSTERVLTLTDFQRRLWDTLSTGKSATVTAPTSAGKSFALQFFLGSQLASRKGFIGLYVVPTRSLIHQVSTAMRQITHELSGREATVLTIPQSPEDAQIESGIYVLTPERLQILLELTPQTKFSLAVVDEAQTLAGDSRGIILQSVVDELRLRAPDMQFLFSTPPASNPEIFAGLFNIAGTPPIEEEESPVAQNLIFLDADSTIIDLVHIHARIRDQRESLGSTRIGIDLLQKPQTLATLSWYFGRDDQNLVYVGSQAASEEVASMISQHRQSSAENSPPESNAELVELSSFLRDHIHPEYLLAETVLNGVAFHYGQMPSVVRQAIEDYFDEGLLRFLVCTSTLLHGVNLPAKNLFLLDPTKGGEWPQQDALPISGPEFWNLAGRAGRLGREFEGNVFVVNQDRWRSNPIDESRKQPIKSALDEFVRDKTADLLKFITERDHGSGSQQGFESAFVRLFNESRRGTLDQTLSRICGSNGDVSEELKAAIEGIIPSITISPAITERHITVSVFRQQQMYDYLCKKIKAKGPDAYIPPHPQSDWTIAHPKMIRLFKRIHNQFERKKTSDRSHIYFAPLALLWMRGEPLPVLIAKSYDDKKKSTKKGNPSISTVIRGLMADIENELRFRYVKFLSCYADILRVALIDCGRPEFVNSIPGIALYLELGASSKTMVNLISLGLSRTSAGVIAAKAANPSMTPQETEDWLRKLNLEANGIPAICIREVEKLWSRS